jgi:hypothetical protein
MGPIRSLHGPLGRSFYFEHNEDQIQQGQGRDRIREKRPGDRQQKTQFSSYDEPLPTFTDALQALALHAEEICEFPEGGSLTMEFKPSKSIPWEGPDPEPITITHEQAQKVLAS